MLPTEDAAREAFEHSRRLAYDTLPRVVRALNALWAECRVESPKTLTDLRDLIETLGEIAATCQRFDRAIFDNADRFSRAHCGPRDPWCPGCSRRC